MNPIEEAVAPLKQKAIDQTEQYVIRVIETAKKKLEEAGWDLKIAAPRPSGREGRIDYQVKMNYHNFLQALTVELKRQRTYSTTEPDLCIWNPEGVTKYIKDAKKQAAITFELYVAKLNKKIGDVKKAELVGTSVWEESYLNIEKEDGTLEVWKTLMIVNTSKLGLVFNQFPTRKMKNIKRMYRSIETL